LTVKLFSQLIQAVNEFKPDEPIVLESQLETLILDYLQEKGFEVERQVIEKTDRYDLICRGYDETVCIELKLRTDTSDIKQYDKYLLKFKDGFIIICWQASSSMKDIFTEVIEQSPIPITLIELSRNYSLA